ncbi:BSD domain-containing protein [Apiospora kogelbergensis]|uniref:BSD domain-containing protein n=1 Tax=Apiospora kogelbergensis TaxID=1337665 RepID=UPI003132481F
MAIPRGTAAYKKKDGILTVTDDQKSIIWTPQANPGGPPGITLAISNVTNLQQTPDTAAKVMLKIFEKAAEGAEPVSYLFHFNSATDPRGEANVLKDLLSRLLAEYKANDPSVPRPAGAAGSGSGSMAFASAVNSKPSSARFFDDAQLKMDIELQQSLMKTDRSLHQMYMEGRSTKPDSMSDAIFNMQFWSTRINLLRAHAIERSQKKGPYNVLATVKPIIEQSTEPDKPNTMKLNITVEQVRMIFDQHPLVKRIYNENVPPLSEGEFWERFFLSKLSKLLRGERATGLEATDRVFDKYDEYEDITAFSSKLLSQHVPHIIDIEGNEENQGGSKGGNRKDHEMRPRGRADVPIIPTLNSISGKMLANVSAADNGPSDTAGSGEIYNQLALRDLRAEADESKIILNIKEQSQFFSNQANATSAADEIFAKQNPSKLLKQVQGDLALLRDDGAGGVDFQASLGINDESDSDDDDKKKKAHVGSRAARKGAQKQILESILQRRAQMFGHSSDETTPMGLPTEIAAKCNLTHATTMEFLHQFWSAFLSGDPDRAAELGYLLESLKRSKERINVVAAEAQKARDQEIEGKKEEIRQIYQRTGKKRKLNANAVRGGKDAVVKLMGPVVKSLDTAIAAYQKALAAEGLQASTEG